MIVHQITSPINGYSISCGQCNIIECLHWINGRAETKPKTIVKQTDRPEPELTNEPMGGPGDRSELQPTFEPLLKPKPEPMIKPTDGLESERKHKVNPSLFLC